MQEQQVKQNGELLKEEGKGEREQQINGARARALDRNGSSVGQKWPFEILNI